MGVEGLYPTLKNRFGKRNLLKTGYPGNVSSIALDLNAIVHPIAQYVYAYGENKDPLNRPPEMIRQLSKETLLEQFFATFFNAVSAIVASAMPRDMVILAFDGPPPEAKLVQQAQRRRVAGTTAKPDATFNSNSITPGTPFMIELDKRFSKWIQDNMNSQASRLPPKVIYSSHLVPGEGEHKIMDIYRNPDELKRQDGIDMPGHHIIYGNDADLLLLTMILPVNKIINTRSVSHFPTPQYKTALEDLARHGDGNAQLQLQKLAVDPEQRISTLEYVDIQGLRKEVRRQLKHGSFDNDALHDFVAMLSLLGNDFIPGFFAFKDMENVIEIMITVYLQNKKPLTILDNKCEDRIYNWEGWRLFLAKLASNEQVLLDGRAAKQRGGRYKFPSNILNAATLIKGGRGKTSVTVQYDKFRSLWYQNALGYRGEVNPVISTGQVAGMAVDYLTTLAWIYQYYQGGTWSINTHWIYRYHHAPMINDVLLTANSITLRNLSPYTYQEDAPWIMPITQLLAVMPTQSADLLPPEARILMTVESPIYYYFPQQFIYELEGVNKEHQGVAIIPFPNVIEITAAAYSLGQMTHADILFNTRDTAPQDVYIIRSATAHEAQVRFKTQQAIIKKAGDALHQAEVERGLCRARKQRDPRVREDRSKFPPREERSVKPKPERVSRQDQTGRQKPERPVPEKRERKKPERQAVAPVVKQPLTQNLALIRLAPIVNEMQPGRWNPKRLLM